MKSTIPILIICIVMGIVSAAQTGEVADLKRQLRELQAADRDLKEADARLKRAAQHGQDALALQMHALSVCMAARGLKWNGVKWAESEGTRGTSK